MAVVRPVRAARVVRVSFIIVVVCCIIYYLDSGWMHNRGSDYDMEEMKSRTVVVENKTSEATSTAKIQPMRKASEKIGVRIL